MVDDPLPMTGFASATIFTSVIGKRTSGQARFATNLARGLAQVGVHVSVVTLSATSEAEKALNGDGITTVVGDVDTDAPGFKASLVSPANPVPKLFKSLVRDLPSSDWSLVLSDDAIGVVGQIEHSKMAYISQGDLNVLYANPSFYTDHKTTKTLFSMSAVANVRRNASSAARYDLLLANSEFCRQFMSFLYGLPFSDVVYPPVDGRVFRADPNSPDGDYGLCVARNNAEQGLDIVSEIAAQYPVVIVGAAHVPNALTLGFVDDSELSSRYRGARVLISPTQSEFYGYPIVEAMACGTPSLVFDTGGPSELVKDHRNGWKVRTREEFLATARAVFLRGPNQEFRSAAIEDSHRFSVEASTQDLVRILSGVRLKGS